MPTTATRDQHRDADHGGRADRSRAARGRRPARGRRRQGVSQQSVARRSRSRGCAELHLGTRSRATELATKKPEAREAVYRNRRRIRGARGLRLLRLRGERLERPFAHLYETGGMRRVHLRGHTNILKRLLIHTGGFNLGLLPTEKSKRGQDTPFRSLQRGCESSRTPDQWSRDRGHRQSFTATQTC